MNLRVARDRRWKAGPTSGPIRHLRAPGPRAARGQMRGARRGIPAQKSAPEIPVIEGAAKAGAAVGEPDGAADGACIGPVGDTVGGLLGDTVGDTVGGLLGDTVLGDTVGGLLGDTVGDTVGGLLGDTVGDTVGGLLGDTVLGDTVGGLLGDAVGWQPRASCHTRLHACMRA
eukprot:gene2265-biopygen4957